MVIVVYVISSYIFQLYCIAQIGIVEIREQ